MINQEKIDLIPRKKWKKPCLITLSMIKTQGVDGTGDDNVSMDS